MHVVGDVESIAAELAHHRGAPVSRPGVEQPRGVVQPGSVDVRVPDLLTHKQRHARTCALFITLQPDLLAPACSPSNFTS